MPMSQSDKANAFHALHEQSELFVMPNAFDGCSANLLSSLGFECAATSSWVKAAMLGTTDGNISRDAALDHAKQIVDATDLPVSSDLENGFGDTPEEAAETIRRAAAIGLVGGSIEDASSDPEEPIYEFAFAVERVRAAIAAARELPFKFTITARSENFVRSRRDLEDTIARLQAFETAGADVLMAPGLPDLDAVHRVCASVNKPVNFMVGIPGKSFTVPELADAGVKRVSLATSLYTSAMGAVAEAAIEIQEQGTFSYLARANGVDFGAILKR